MISGVTSWRVWARPKARPTRWLACAVVAAACSDEMDVGADAATAADAAFDASLQDANDATDVGLTTSGAASSSDDGTTNTRDVYDASVSTTSYDADTYSSSTNGKTELTSSNAEWTDTSSGAYATNASFEPDASLGLSSETADSGSTAEMSTGPDSLSTVSSIVSDAGDAGDADGGNGGLDASVDSGGYADADASEATPDDDLDASEAGSSGDASLDGDATEPDTGEPPIEGDAGDGGAGYYCSACSVYVPNRGCKEYVRALEYEGGVPSFINDRFELAEAFTCNEPPPSSCPRSGNWRVSFPSWQGCWGQLTHPDYDGTRVPMTSYEFTYPTEEPNNDPFTLEWEPGDEPCTMKGTMGGYWESTSELGAFAFEIVLRVNGDSACGTLHYVEEGFAPHELITAAVAERIP